MLNEMVSRQAVSTIVVIPYMYHPRKLGLFHNKERDTMCIHEHVFCRGNITAQNHVVLMKRF